MVRRYLLDLYRDFVVSLLVAAARRPPDEFARILFPALI